MVRVHKTVVVNVELLDSPLTCQLEVNQLFWHFGQFLAGESLGRARRGARDHHWEISTEKKI